MSEATEPVTVHVIRKLILPEDPTLPVDSVSEKTTQFCCPTCKRTYEYATECDHPEPWPEIKPIPERLTGATYSGEQ